MCTAQAAVDCSNDCFAQQLTSANALRVGVIYFAVLWQPLLHPRSSALPTPTLERPMRCASAWATLPCWANRSAAVAVLVGVARCADSPAVRQCWRRAACRGRRHRPDDADRRSVEEASVDAYGLLAPLVQVAAAHCACRCGLALWLLITQRPLAAQWLLTAQWRLT